MDRFYTKEQAYETLEKKIIMHFLCARDDG